MTRDEMEHVAEAAAQRGAEKALAGMLERLGFDTDDHRSAQADMLYLRKSRQAAESRWSKITLTVLGLGVTGAWSVFVVGIREWMKAHGS